MKLKNDPYFPIIALAMIAALILSVVSPTPSSAAHAATPADRTAQVAPTATPANTLTASAAAITPAE